MRAILQHVFREIHGLAEIEWGENNKVRRQFMELCETKVKDIIVAMVFQDKDVQAFIAENKNPPKKRTQPQKEKRVNEPKS